jgi:hypothetical protein
VPAPTNSEKIDQLVSNAATQNERVNNLREEFERFRELLGQTETFRHDLDKNLAILEKRVEHLEMAAERRSSRGWQLWLLVLTAIGTSLLNLITNPKIWSYLRHSLPN